MEREQIALLSLLLCLLCLGASSARSAEVGCKQHNSDCNGTTVTGMQLETDDQSPAPSPTHSPARNWNEALLYAIRRDFARPTVHARNLYHVSAVMYDSWAVYDKTASPVFLGRTQSNGVECAFTATDRLAIQQQPDSELARLQTLSVAAHRLLSHRFATSPGAAESLNKFDQLLAQYGIDTYPREAPFDVQNPVELGSYLAQCLIDYGQSDGSNEANNYANQYYQAANASLNPALAGNPTLANPDRWQPLQLNTFIDQSGNLTSEPEFLSAEWGDVQAFALSSDDAVTYVRDNQEYQVYLDPGAPATVASGSSTTADYLWGHALVAAWSSHLDPSDGVLWDISPAAIGNSDSLPNSIAELQHYYRWQEGGAEQQGRQLNPVTGEVYATNIVPRGDYTRVLAEFWADGPDSETPPGHWFSIFNEKVLDHPNFERRFEGVGDELDALEYEVRGYLLLGGAMHDAAIVAWSAKGWYDYIRPVSALRIMAENGQSSDPQKPFYHEHGAPLVDGFIELVERSDPLAGNGGTHVGKLKVKAWRGPAFIANTTTDMAGVGWILLENWWPYQRPTFVTPPFAGYVSGHSTFSRAAAEILTRLTGSEYFPGGLAEFTARKNEFLVFEQGPSVDVVLQWATYRDASDQTSLSRIWGGIHPPVDDIPGRQLGIKVAERVFEHALAYFNGETLASEMNGDTVVQSSNPFSNPMSGSGCSLATARTATGDARRDDPVTGLDLGLALLLLLWVRRYRTSPTKPS